MTTDSQTTTDRPLRGLWLRLARAAWLVVVALNYTLLITYLPAYYDLLANFATPNIDLEATRVGLAELGLTGNFYAAFTITFNLIFTCIALASSALIFWRRSDDWLALLFSLTFALMGATFVIDPASGIPFPWDLVVRVSSVYALVMFFSLFYAFPDGRFVPRWGLWLTLFWIALLFAGALFPDSRADPDTWPTFAEIALTAVIVILPFAAQVYRYRRVSNSLQRQQTKWVVSALGVTVVLIFVTLVIPPLFVPALMQPGILAALFNLYSQASVVFIPSLIPLSIVVAMLRYRLWDIDFLINRSLVYGALTGLLLAFFGLSLLIVSQLFQNFAGGPLVAVAISAGAFGAIFQPARRRLQRFVDQRFYHIQIDYQKTPAPAATNVTSVIKQTGFGEYQGLELIGRGGMAEIYKSTHPTLGVPVAIKILPAHLAADPDFRKRFTREAETVSKLQHPHIIRVFDFGESGGTHYMVMEYVAGKDLGHHLTERGRLSFAEAIFILKGIASALDYAHAQGLIHRDIKPSNILLDTTAAILNPKLTDFGIAKMMGHATRYTHTGDVLGTFDYIAPEQIQGAANIDRRADIYAFGIVAHQMLTGQLPFQHNNPGALLIAHLTQPPPDPRDLMPEISAETARAIRRAMAKNPDERYPTAGEFVNTLQ